MPKKIILLAAAIIVIIGVGLYLFFASSVGKDLKKTGTPEVVLPGPVPSPIERREFQEIEYEIISIGGPTYDIITGQLTEEEVRLLAEKIINDILAKEPNSQEITLLFYSDLIPLGAGEVDVAEIKWTPEGTTVNMVDS